MKKSRLSVFLGTFLLGLLALCLSRAQPPSHPLKVVDATTGKEIHTLMADQHNALLAQLEAAGQTNAIELFRQYRSAYGADLASSELGDTVAALRSLREGRTNQAIQVLEQHLSRYANIMCNSYGGLSPTNRERVKLESLQQTRDYYAQFPPPAWGAETERAVKEVLRLQVRRAGNEINR
jgi:hypothetical protein